MITLKSIKLNNFLSHADTKIEFNENQKLLIDGASGSGKSGIVEGLIWCLYGKSRVDNNRSLIKHDKPSASVEVELNQRLHDSIEHHTYKIIRYVTKGGKHAVAIEMDGEPVPTAGIRGSQEYIENEILKSSYLLFINSIAYPQDNIDNFVKQPADKRKDIMLEIINASAYDKYYERTKEEMTDRQNKTIISKDKLAFMEKELETAKEAHSGLQEAQNDLKKKELNLATAETGYAVLQNEINSLDAKKEESKGLYAQNSQFADSIEKLREHNDVISKKLAEIDDIDVTAMKKKVDTIPGVKSNIKELELLETSASEWNDKYIKITSELPIYQDYDALIADLNKQLIKVIEERIEKCPELDKPCPLLVRKQDERTEELEAKIKTYEKAQEEQTLEVKKHEDKLQAIGSRPMTDKDGLNNLRDKLHDLLIVKTEYEKYQDKEKLKKETKTLLADNGEQIIKHTMEMTINEEKIKEIDVALGKYDENIKKLAELKQSTVTMHNDIMLLKVTLTKKLDAKRKIEELKKSMKEIEDENKDIIEELEALQLLKDAFSPRGIKAMVVDYVIPRIEEKINEILGKLSDFSVKLDTQRDGVKSDTTLEGLFITIVNELGEEFDYNNYSGGEKLKIIVAITEALAEIQNISFRILDELFVGLDEDSTENFAEVMETLNNRFSQMICISHLREIKEAFPEKITMSKINGTTKIL